MKIQQNKPYCVDGVAQSLQGPALLGYDLINGHPFKTESILFDSPPGLLSHPGFNNARPGLCAKSYRFTDASYAGLLAWFPPSILRFCDVPEVDLWVEIARKVPVGAWAETQPTPASKALPAGGTTVYRFEKGTTPLLGECIRIVYVNSGVPNQQAPAVLGRHRLNELMVELMRKYWP